MKTITAPATFTTRDAKKALRVAAALKQLIPPGHGVEVTQGQILVKRWEQAHTVRVARIGGRPASESVRQIASAFFAGFNLGAGRELF